MIAIGGIGMRKHLGIYASVFTGCFGLLLSGCQTCPAVGCAPRLTVSVSDEVAALGEIIIELDGEQVECPSADCSLAMSGGDAAYWFNRQAERVDVFIVDEDENIIEHFEKEPEYRENEALVFPDCDENCPDFASVAVP